MLNIYIFAGVLIASLVLFVTNWLRYDIVALLALLVLTLTGIVPMDETFNGFSNPAVVTVAAVLVISKALELSGISATAGRVANLAGSRPVAQVGFYCVLVAFLSAFINNVGALALLMPVAIETAHRDKRSPSYLLMPMAFCSLLGGMTTLIGTPPNLLVSNFRASHVGEPFRMFDFAPTGFPITMVGITFITLIGWRLIPRRSGGSQSELFDIANYMAEVEVAEESTAIGKSLAEIMADAEDITLAGVRRGKQRLSILDRHLRLQAGDLLILRANSRNLQQFSDANQLHLAGVKPGRAELRGGEMELVEAVVTKGSTAEHSSARRLDLRNLFGINMIAIARRGVTIAQELKNFRFQAGDIVLLQMPSRNIRNALSQLGLLPLARRELHVMRVRRLVISTAIFGTAITATALGYLPSAVAFSVAALAMILTGVIGVRQAYEAVDWSIIVLLGAMIPVGNAFESTGAVRLIADSFATIDSFQHPVLMLVILLVLTMFLSDILNNAATAIVMCPLAVAIASNLKVSPDPYLMAVAVGASCAFLTPVGHQSNTLVMGPGGYHFGDYFRMGILLEVLVAAVSVPLLVWYWGLALPELPT